MVGATCLLDPLDGGNARLVQLLEPYQLPPEVCRVPAAGSCQVLGVC